VRCGSSKLLNAGCVEEGKRTGRKNGRPRAACHRALATFIFITCFDLWAPPAVASEHAGVVT